VRACRPSKCRSGATFSGCRRSQTRSVCAAHKITRDFGTKPHDTGEIQAIDATGIDCIAASQHSAKRTIYTFKAVKTNALIDLKTGAILDIQCSMKQPHDTKIGWQLLQPNLENVTKITADKGYHWALLRHKFRVEGSNR
jgi:IS5 family transposase